MKLKKYLPALAALCLILSCSKEEPEPVIPVNLAPGIPIQLLPAQNEKCTPVNLLFQWRETRDPEGDRVFYRLQVSTDENFRNIVQSRQTEVPEVILDLEPGNILYWRVKAVDAQNESDYSTVRTFFTEPDPVYNSIPYQPEQVSPGNGVFVTENNALLEWTANDPDGDELSYDIYFGTQDPPGLLVADQKETTKEVAIEPNKPYYWKVVVIDAHGAKSIGSVWYFKS